MIHHTYTYSCTHTHTHYVDTISPYNVMNYEKNKINPLFRYLKSMGFSNEHSWVHWACLYNHSQRSNVFKSQFTTDMTIKLLSLPWRLALISFEVQCRTQHKEGAQHLILWFLTPEGGDWRISWTFCALSAGMLQSAGSWMPERTSAFW